MKRFRLLGVALLAFMALGVAGASVASAENPEILPLPTTAAPLKFTSISAKGSEPVLESAGGVTIKCKKLTNKGEFTSARLGLVTLDFEGECESKGAKCKAEGDASGTILLSKADIHLVAFKISTVLRLGVAVTVPPATNLVITCGVIKTEVKGTAIGLASGITKDTKTKTVTAEFKQTKGAQEQKTCELDEAFCKGKTYNLESTLGGSFEQSGEAVIDEITFEKEAEVHF
jgi:hypothetical protein